MVRGFGRFAGGGDPGGDPDGPDAGGALVRSGEALVGRLVESGPDSALLFPGAGPMPGSRLDPVAAEIEIARLIRIYRRYVAAGGFVSGLGGFATLAVALPADAFYFLRAGYDLTLRIAYLRGYDVESEHVRSTLLVSMLGAEGTALLNKAGVKAGNRAATLALQRLPAPALARLNRMVGLRLLARFGAKGSTAMARVVPVAGGAVGAGVNVAGINAIAAYAKRNFPRVEPAARNPASWT